MNYTAANTKIMAMSGRLLSDADYKDLSRLESVDDVSDRLRAFEAYGGSLAAMPAEAFHRVAIEQRLEVSMINDFWRLYTFISDGAMRRYLYAFFMKKEIQVIKLILAMVCGEKDRTYTEDVLSEWLGKRSPVNIKTLFASAGIHEFIDNLEGLPYYHHLKHVISDDSGIFQVEMQLDIFYYINLWRMQNSLLTKTDREIMNDIIGTEIDLRNIMWIYRFKKYFQANPHFVIAYLIPIKHRMQSGDINKLIEMRGELDQDILSSLLPKIYSKVFTEETTLEYDFFYAMHKKLKAYKKKAPSSIAALIAYLYERDREISNLTTLIEGVSYGLSPEKIMEYLYLWESAV